MWRAASQFFDRLGDDRFSVTIRLDKHLPDGAGMGGGSADAAFTLAMLADLAKEHAAECTVTSKSGITKEHVSVGAVPSEAELAEMALRLGADCPFFLLNRPAYAEGVGERLQPVPLDLSGRWLLVVKPDVSVSTREAFAGVTPKAATFDLRTLPSLPIERWREVVHNDFEDSIFPQYPRLAEHQACALRYRCALRVADRKRFMPLWNILRPRQCGPCQRRNSDNPNYHRDLFVRTVRLYGRTARASAPM